MDTIKITPKIRRLVADAIKVAVSYEKMTGRKLGITGEVGEILACDTLGLKLLADPIASGFDAIDAKGKKYQIKTARKNKGNRGRMSRFSKHKFDYAVLATLNTQYEMQELWRADYATIMPVIKRQE